MSEAMDICMNCTVKGDIDACLKTPCSQHNSWFAKTIIAEAEKQEPAAVGLLSVRYHRGSKLVPITEFDYKGELPEGDYELYTHPQPRTWVGLTEDDKVLIKHDANFNQFMTAGEYADRVQQLTEARLKDKNNG